MKDFQALTEEVRSRNDIVDVVGGYVHLQKKGSTYFGLCPFHNEKTPSFSVTPSKQMYYCFGCQRGGNVFTFLMEYEHMTFREALDVLAEKAGVEIPKNAYSDSDRAKDRIREKLLEVNKAAAIYYAYKLKSPQGEAGMDYFKSRGLTDDTIAKFGLGFASISNDELTSYLKSKGFEDQVIIDAGLANFDEKRGLHDRFWNRVMYPIQDERGRVIGFGGRVMGDGEPKYLNSKETLVFDKGRNLYGLNLARSSREDYFILCEGYMDVIAMHQAGFNMAIASLGTAFTSGQASIVSKKKHKAYLAYDSDGAGTGAALKAISILRDMNMSCRVINMLPYKDPDEFIKKLGKEEFKKRIDEAEDSFMFEMRIKERDYDLKDAESRSEFTHVLASSLLVFEDEVRRENYTVAICDKYQIPLDQMKRLIVSKAAKGEGRTDFDHPKSGIVSEMSDKELALRNQRYLITWLSDDPSIYPIVRKYIEPDDFGDELYRNVLCQMYADLEEGRSNPAAIISTFEDEEDQNRVASLFNTALVVDGERDRGTALHDIIYMIKKNAVEERSKMDTDIIDAESVLRQMNDKKALEELRRATIKI